MKIYANSGESVNIGIWGYEKGKFRPLQTYNPIEEFDISINYQKITVFYNKSKSSVDYYYLKFNDLWYWSRDNIKKYSQYTA